MSLRMRRNLRKPAPQVNPGPRASWRTQHDAALLAGKEKQNPQRQQEPEFSGPEEPVASYLT